MYILISSFTQPPEIVHEYFEEHCVWLHKYRNEGVFLASGPKKSKLGGFVLVNSIKKSQLMKILAEDSYVKADIADYQIVDVDCKLSAPYLDKLIGA